VLGLKSKKKGYSILYIGNKAIKIIKEGSDTIVRVPLGDKGEVQVTLDIDDYHKIVTIGILDSLGYYEAFGKTFVTYVDPASHKPKLLARLISGSQGVQVYRDNNTLNLRASNLTPYTYSNYKGD
jgi:hypothetical protein